MVVILLLLCNLKAEQAPERAPPNCSSYGYSGSRELCLCTAGSVTTCFLGVPTANRLIATRLTTRTANTVRSLASNSIRNSRGEYGDKRLSDFSPATSPRNIHRSSTPTQRSFAVTMSGRFGRIWRETRSNPRCRRGRAGF